MNLHCRLERARQHTTRDPGVLPPRISCGVRKPGRGEVVLLAAGLAAAFLVLETAVRLLAWDRPAATGYAPVNTKRRAMRPRNTAGYRDRERTVVKPPGVRRVVSLGDSFAWGASVEFEDAYPQRLERGLTRRRRERWEVVNLALPGMNTVDQAGQLAGEGLAYAPDAVLLGYVLNDSEDAQAAEARRAEDWAQSRAAPSPSPLDRSALVRLVRTRLWATAENRRRVSGYLSMYADDASGWIAARRALKEMGDRCRAGGVPFVVAIFPLFGNPLDDRYPFEAIHGKVADAAAAAGARVVDLLPVYRGLRWELLVVDGVDDEHPNEIAHRIAAGALLHALDDVVPWIAPREPEEGEEPPAVSATRP
jgi:hypothetical protein